MAMIRWMLLFFLVALALSVARGDPAPNATHIQINVLIGVNGASAIQCWSIDPPLNISQQAGTVGAKIQSIGDIERSTVVFFSTTNDTDAGFHRAPDPQWVFVLKGNGVVTIPTTNATLPLPEGDIIIAADTANVSELGHETKWAKGTVVIQAPFKDGLFPGYTIVNPSGPCLFTEGVHHHDN